MGNTGKDTKNIKFVAYLRFKGHEILKIERIARGKARYWFDLTEDEWVNLKLEFDRSNECKYAQCLDAVVDLAH